MASSSEKSAAKANLLGKRKPEDVLETKPILRKHKEKSEEKETTKGFADTLPQIELLETKSDQANLISVKEAAIRRKKTLYVSNLSPQVKISDVINFFKDVGEVVRVRLRLSKRTEYVGIGFVEFASSNQAKKALEKNNGEYLDDHKIFLDVAKKFPYPPQNKYFVEHKVCYGVDYLRPENLLIEEDEAVERLDETPDFVEVVLFVANLSPQTKMIHIVSFFKYVVEVVSVRLIVNHEGKHVGYGFVEFASAKEAKKALEKKNGEYLHDHKIFLNVAKKAPYPPGPKYNLAEMLCYEDYLRRESLLIEEDETVKGLDESTDFVEEVAIREKTLFVDNLSGQTEISHIINFFKDVGEVVHVRLIVDNKGTHVGYGFVEFASANEAKKALEKNNGEYLHDNKIFLDVAKKFPYPPPSKYCIDHKVWYEDYLRQESLRIEEDEAVEGLDETPDFVEDVAVRKKTLFVYNLSYEVKISYILSFFKGVGEIVGIRLIVNEWGDLVGCGFVEFASANQAKQALQIMDRGKLRCRKIFLDMVKIAPYPLRPKYTLGKKLRYEDYLPLESLEEDDLETKPKRLKVPIFCGKKMTFSKDD